MSLPEDKSPPVEVDATDLTREEWFFLHAAFGQRPDASLRDAHEWQKQSLGLPRAEQQLLFRLGLDRLMARGVIAQETDKDGKPVFDAQGQPVLVGRGRIVSRVQPVEAKRIIH